jgi:hypothetical protein
MVAVKLGNELATEFDITGVRGRRLVPKELT